MGLQRISRNLLITTWDVWLAVSDGASAIHRPEFWRSQKTTEGLLGSVRALREANEIVDWTVVVDGTFLVQCVLEEADFGKGSAADVCEVRALRLPTGRLTLRTAGDAAAELPVFDVPPGEYETRLEWFAAEEWRNYGVTDASQYSPTGKPEGIVTIRKRMQHGG
jgi:hypothetical protein